MAENKLWLCFVDGTSGGYGHKHDTLESATQEAERLSKLPLTRGRKVLVLELVCSCEVPEVPVQWTWFI